MIQKIDEIIAGIRMPEIPAKEFPVECASGEDISPALQEALKKCAASGGGRILLPPGSFRCGRPIVLPSHTELHLADGTYLKFAFQPDAYLPQVFTRWEGVEIYNLSPMIYADKATDIAITGRGIISGSWEEFAQWRAQQKPAQQKARSFAEQGVPAKQRVMTPEDFLRPSFVQFINCERLLLAGPTFTNTTFWMIHPVYCRHVTIRNVHLDSMMVNNDGIDVDSCEDVLIEDSTFRNGDDAIVIKSGRDQDGIQIGRPTRRVAVRRCTFFEALHGFAIGSELSGGAEDIFIEDVVMKKIFFIAISLKSMKGRGGEIRNIHVSRVRVDEAGDHLVLLTNNYSSLDPHGSAMTLFDRIFLTDIQCGFAQNAFGFQGTKERPFGQLKLKNIAVLDAKTVCSKREYAEDISCENVMVNSAPADFSK